MHSSYLKFSLTIKTQSFNLNDHCTVMTLVKLTLLVANLAGSLCHGPKESMYNIGWDKFLEDSPEEFHNLPLTWETENPIPDYIVGSYIKNGPSQKRLDEKSRKRLFTI